MGVWRTKSHTGHDLGVTAVHDLIEHPRDVSNFRGEMCQFDVDLELQTTLSLTYMTYSVA